jgi:hypothetical protein
MILSQPTLHLLAEALRALATELDQAGTGEVGTPAAKPAGANGAGTTAPKSLSTDALAEVRKQALEIIRTALDSDPAGAAAKVQTVLGRFRAARVSELTDADVAPALDALRVAIGVH